jgi:copper chaperone
MRSTLRLKIDGMHCGACVRRVQAALGKVDSVNVRDVQIGSAEVDYDPQSTSSDSIVAAVNGIGFSAAVQAASNQ